MLKSTNLVAIKVAEADGVEAVKRVKIITKAVIIGEEADLAKETKSHIIAAATEVDIIKGIQYLLLIILYIV